MDKLCELIKQANEIIINRDPVQLINELEHKILDQNDEILKLSNELKNIDNKYLEQINKLSLDLESKIIELKQKNEEIKNFAKFSIIQKVNKQLEEKNSYIQILESQLEKIKNNKFNQPISPKIVIPVNKISDEPVVVSVEETHNKPIKSKKSVKQPVEEPIKETVEVPVDEPVKEPVKSKKSVKEPVEVPVEVPVKEPVEVPFEEPNDEPIKEPVKTKKSVKKTVEDSVNNNFNPDHFVDINGFELIMYKKKYYLRDLEINHLYDIQDNKPNKIVGIYTTNGKVKLN